ncbi:MAG: TonB-dependent receptor [Acidobacteriaceae bacterium]|nr:TonB-dependent receptor [Acidobacteriaceae bacterium]
MSGLFRSILPALCLLAFAASVGSGQDPTGTLEGQVSDQSGAVIPRSSVTLTNLGTGFTAHQETSSSGNFRFSYLPVGSYRLLITASGFAPYDAKNMRVDVDRVVNLPVTLTIGSRKDTVDISAEGATVDVSATLGTVVSSHEGVDLPLNGRNLTQLGLLQPGVAPLTFGLLQAGGIARANQAYAVNGEPPESNNYLLDGVTNVDSVNGGFAIRVPPDAVTEFRILTSNAPPEYGETSGATTSVVMRSGTNAFHGSLYDFLRNNAFDARNFFAASTEPLHQNQFGATLGGAIRRDKDFFFLYYEGQRDRQGETRTAIVPTAAQRTGNFSGATDSAGNPVPLINELTGQPFSYNGVSGQIPPNLLNPISLKAESLIPLPNNGPSLFSSTQLLTNNYDQGGVRLDHYFTTNDQIFARYAVSSLHQLDPLPINGSGVPGFPVTNDVTTNSATISYVHLYSPQLVQTARSAFFRNVFLRGAASNHTPASSLGFTYEPTLSSALGIPYLILSGYTDVGNPITGPQNTYQTDYQGYYSLAWTRGRHNFKFGGDIDRQQINVLLGIATNGFFVFAPFPASDSFASFLLGQPVQFFQGGGDFSRGLRKWIVAGYAQDEWRVTPKLTLSYGLRYEVNTPYTDIRNRLNAWAPGKQSSIYPSAPAGLLFPGDPGVPAGIAPIDYHQFMPRIGIAWDPVGDAKTTIRAGYGIFYDGFTNGAGGPLQAAVSALPWTEAYQLPGPGMNFANPYNGATPPFVLQQFVRPATVLTVQSGMLPPYSQNWNFSIEHVFANSYLFDIRYVGNKGTHLPRFVEANPAIYGPGATPGNADQRRLYAGCDASGSCAFASVGLIADDNASTYNALQVSLSRQLSNNLWFQASYWWSKSLDYVSSLNIAGSAPTLVAGENDLAQNPLDLRAEHGPSLFDAKHRFVFSGTYALPRWDTTQRFAGALVNGWQLNTIVSLASGTPFTVYDSDNAPMQGSAPEITGFYSSRPNVLSDPNLGPHTPNKWVSRNAYQQLTPAANPGQFGNEGRNAVRGPGLASADISLFKNFSVSESARVQFRAEAFNALNHPNFALPENDVASPEFGQILQAAPPRLLQLALKFVF